MQNIKYYKLRKHKENFKWNKTRNARYSLHYWYRKIYNKKRWKILEQIIKPKDNLIKELYQDNLSLHKELSKQSKVINEAEKYQKERDKILADNEELHNTVKTLEHEYKSKSNNLDFDFRNRKRELEEEFEENTLI